MKKILYYIIIFIIFCFLGDQAVNYSIAKQIEEQSPYCLSFASIGANLLESRLDCWAKIRPAKTFIEMDQALIGILNLLKLPIEKEGFKHQELNGKKTLRYEIVCKEQSYHFTLQNDANETYFLLTGISSKDDKELRLAEEILKNALQCKCYFQYKGVIATRLNADDRKEYTKILLKSLQAKQMDCYEDNNMISISAYSPNLKNGIAEVELAGKKYSLQMVIHSDKNNQSYVYLGFPLLLNDY